MGKLQKRNKGNKGKNAKSKKKNRDQTQQQPVDSLNKKNKELSENANKKAITTISAPTLIDDVDFMTSSDFRNDNSAHLQTMLEQVKDSKTVEFFKRCILENEHLYRGKTVLVLRCHVGLLALFAAKAGAASVYALDYSNVADYARRVVSAQKKYANIIKVYKGRVADVELPVSQVDIIICNWMGHALLHDSECLELIEARDKWLKPNGFIVPDIGRIFIATTNNTKGRFNRMNWWLNVYGFRMENMSAYALSEPSYTKVSPSELSSRSQCVHTIDMHKATTKSLCFRSMFSLDIIKPGYISGLVLYFDVEFSRSHVPCKLSTGPLENTTSQWMQTMFTINDLIMLRQQYKYYGGVEIHSKADDDEDFNLNNLEVRIEIYDCGGSFDRKNPIYNVLLHQRWQLRTSSIDLNKSILEQNKDCLCD